MKFGLSLLLALWSCFAAAQDGKVTLRVRAKGSGVPISKAEIKGLSSDQLFTDKQGQVELQIPAGNGAIEVYRHTYETLSVPFADLRATSSYDAFLLPAVPNDNEIIIRGAKRQETSRKTVTIQEAIKVAPGGDPAQIPKLLPGVQSETFGPGIVVRGSGPNDSRYAIDEWEVPFIFHRVGGISIIPEQILSDVEFSSGGFGAQYGGATGGVVVLRTKSEVPERATTEFRVNIPLYSSLYHGRPIDDGKAYFAVSARRSYIETLLPIILKQMNEEADSLTLVPVFGDAHLYYFRPTDGGHWKMLVLGAYDGLQLAFPSDIANNEDGRGEFNLRDSVTAIGLEWKSALDRDWTLTIAPQLTNVESKFNIVGNRINLGVRGPRVKGELARRLTGKERLYVGAEVERLIGTADVLAPQIDENDPFFDFEEAPKEEVKVTQHVTNVSTWLSVDQELGPVMLTPGVRAFYASSIQKSSADPRLNARYQVTSPSAIKAAVGQYSKFPEYRDTSEKFGNKDLDFIKSNHYVLGVETNWDDRWTTDFQGFYKDTRNLVRQDPETNTNNDGSQIAYGAEAFIRRNLTQRLFGWLSYTYSKNRERDSDAETYRNSQYDQTHVANLVGNYKLTSIWELGGRLIYHTGDTFTTVDDAVYNANLDKYQARRSAGSRLYDGRLPSYHELDIYANREFLFDTWKMALRFGVEYLALERQPAGVQYNYDFSKKEFFRNIPPIPYIEFRGTL